MLRISRLFVANKDAAAHRRSGTTIGRTRLPVVVLACLALAAFGAAGCGDDNGDEAVPDPNDTSQLGDANNYGYGTEEPRKNSDGELLPPPVQIYAADDAKETVSTDTVDIITSQSEFEAMQKRLFGSKNERPLPSTDFKTRQMILVLLKPEKDGASTQVTTVRKKSDSFTVTSLRLLPGKGCPRQNANTHAFSIVETDKLKGSAKLKVKDQDRPPC